MILVNGEEKPQYTNASIAHLLAGEGYSADKVVVECDGQIVRKEARGGHILTGNETIEVVTFVGGG